MMMHVTVHVTGAHDLAGYDIYQYPTAAIAHDY
jgi:hypothetical protein